MGQQNNTVEGTMAKNIVVQCNKKEFEAVIESKAKNKEREGKSREKDILAVLCHGFTATKETGLIKFISTELSKSGILSIRFDFIDKKEKKNSIIKHPSLKDEENALLCVLDYAKEKYKPEKIIVIGHSLGGTIIQMAADKISADLAVLISPALLFRLYYDIEVKKKTKESREGEIIIKKNSKNYSINKMFIRELFAISPEELSKKITVPVLLAYGTNDYPNSTPEAVMQLYNSIKSEKELLLVKNANHDFSGKNHKQKLAKAIVRFIKKHANK